MSMFTSIASPEGCPKKASLRVTSIGVKRYRSEPGYWSQDLKTTRIYVKYRMQVANLATNKVRAEESEYRSDVLLI